MPGGLIEFSRFAALAVLLVVLGMAIWDLIVEIALRRLRREHASLPVDDVDQLRRAGGL